jgi:serine O-acetyltransferase
MFKRFREDIATYMQRDPAANSRLEVILCYAGLHAIWLHRIAHYLHNKNLRLVARLISSFARFCTGVEIHPAAKIGRRLVIDHGMGVVIGETAEIGDDVTIYHGVTLGGISLQKIRRHPKIENSVIIGAGAKLLGAITVGSNARIGSNAVVTKDVANDETVVGVPAHAISNKVSGKKHTSENGSYGGEFANAYDPIFQELARLNEEIALLKNKVN